MGDTVAAALKLFQGEPRLKWTVAASVQAVRLVTGAVRTGQRALVQVPGRAQPLETLEILGLASAKVFGRRRKPFRCALARVKRRAVMLQF